MRRALITGPLCALLATGCGGGHPVRHVRSTTTGASAIANRASAIANGASAVANGASAIATGASAIAQAQARHEYPSPPPPPQTATGGASTPQQAIRAFVTAYINWTADTVAARMRALAARAIGQARAAMTLAASETAADYELQRGGIANHGAVEAVAPLAGSRDQYVVVTQESTTATNTTAYQGLLPAWHVALATAQELPNGLWVLSGWQPEN